MRVLAAASSALCAAVIGGTGCIGGKTVESIEPGDSRPGRVVDLEFDAGGARRVAALWIPAGYDEHPGDWPLIVFLHGLGERGDDGRQQTVGILPAIEAHPERFPCLVLMPQCPLDRVWVAIDADWARPFLPAEDHVDAALDETLRRYRVDRGRVALTGLSMGGFGTLIHGASHVDRYCALVAVCGGGRTQDAAALAQRPLWLIHGEADPLVPAELSRSMARAVAAAGGDVRYTGYPRVGHNAWDRAYADPEVIRFLLQRR